MGYDETARDSEESDYCTGLQAVPLAVREELRVCALIT